jgi:hypothetical protein
MTLTKITEKFGNREGRKISRMAIYRHSKHALAQVNGHRPLTTPVRSDAGESLLQRVETLINESRYIAEQAKTERQWLAATASLREIRSCIELLGKLSGELSSQNINFFAIDLTEDRIREFLDAAKLRGPQVGDFVREQVTKRFGNPTPNLTINFVKPPAREGAPSPTAAVVTGPSLPAER